ncbi:hypothetical protein GCM10009678_62540 [Actinomadura kijaniata]|uniref:Uncharacterized protein n=1 Tax=Actinomadura namibiensis TaxID=182080 RepID=A0A7W3QRG7_ACTNM|nr:hypothetical protein [Actinomadura namibiensis]MBA8956338.1 hypothetical protein [Actinomadura namibiensis]
MLANRNLARTVLVPALVLGAVCSSSAAFASTGGHAAPVAKDGNAAPVVKREMKRGMTLVRFDAAVAKANGYKIVTYANGDQQSVPIARNSKKPKSPILRHGKGVKAANSDYDKVVGNCGTAWIAVRQTARNKVQVGTGFTVSSPAISYGWKIKLSDRNGTSAQSAGGALAARTQWARTWSNLNQYGWTFDHVEKGAAHLANGGVCFAGRPGVSIRGLG